MYNKNNASPNPLSDTRTAPGQSSVFDSPLAPSSSTSAAIAPTPFKRAYEHFASKTETASNTFPPHPQSILSARSRSLPPPKRQRMHSDPKTINELTLPAASSAAASQASQSSNQPAYTPSRITGVFKQFLERPTQRQNYHFHRRPQQQAGSSFSYRIAKPLPALPSRPAIVRKAYNFGLARPLNRPLAMNYPSVPTPTVNRRENTPIPPAVYHLRINGLHARQPSPNSPSEQLCDLLLATLGGHWFLEANLFWFAGVNSYPMPTTSMLGCPPKKAIDEGAKLSLNTATTFKLRPADVLATPEQAGQYLWAKKQVHYRNDTSAEPHY